MTGDIQTPTPTRATGIYLGVGLVALGTLVLQLVNTRLLSVMTWYHLAFLAISLAMLGMTAGAIYTYLRPRHFAGGALPGRLVRYGAAFAVSAPASHLALLAIPIPTQIGSSPQAVWILVAVGLLAAIPFFASGVVIALTLTRVPLPIGRLYAADLLGAGAGCLLAIPLLNLLDPTSGLFLLGGAMALATLAYARAYDGGRAQRRALVLLALGLFAVGGVNSLLYPDLFRVTRMKGRPVPEDLLIDRWNSHSRVTAPEVRQGPPALWGPGANTPQVQVRQLPLRIDGGAFTAATAFDGDLAQLDWLRFDLTTLGHHLKRGAEVAVIGVGGGRDLLTALAFECRRVTGIEINGALLDLLEGELAELTGLAGREDVRLVHDDGRSYLARSPAAFDLVQMSLVDTWASTAAGAMTLTENGLYTVEAWRTYLRSLRPDGLLTVSRWYAPNRPGETARLLSLATASLLAEGVEEPGRHLVLARSGRLSTLLVSRSPFTQRQIRILSRAAERFGFGFLLHPGRPAGEPLLARIVESGTPAELTEATAHPLFDLTAATDERPFFFNMLKPAAWLRSGSLEEEAGGVLAGNLQATQTLMGILMAVALLVAVTIVGPLLALGRHHGLSGRRFVAAATYFSLIGLGFMLVEIALIQRFSVLLGHPIYSLAVTLMSLIVAAGIGSALSDRFSLEGRGSVLWVPLGIAGMVFLVLLMLRGPLVEWLTPQPLSLRIAAVLAATLPLGMALGFAFPTGMRLLRRHSETALSWMWGLNGAFGVLGSIFAILLSMAFGLGTCLAVGALCYLLLVVPAGVLWRGREA